MHGLEEETVVTMIKNTIPLSRPINNNRPTGLKFNLPFSSKKGLWLDVLARKPKAATIEKKDVADEI
ncbi:hypothetical protein PGT21_014681 [Puccinia graminis f. sp. tritici]|uniref:Uncharacterized protein n=1 Tax=Puccinia graminis f. sp. tritici TaxID=56615 RepID=A0A5B0NX85_PUCGR|nr:hypothetical protein PGT21_014681 [Puccinia graminis f. sp. tritici]KAA1093256.1 hypothetical protein PGTUg99_004092 [Puccinia graminis f. sp. tritici]